MSVEIEIVPCLSDNYAYLVKSGTDCAVVDPSEPEPVKAALAKLGWTPTHILNTHHHIDHTGGNLALKAEFGVQVVGPAKDAARIPGLDIGVDEASGWSFDGRPVRVLEVPAHTRGAITFVIDGNAFTGDTLFSGGCGRLFEGTPAQMLESLDRLAALPGNTRVCCTHEYTLSNLKFARAVEPGNAALLHYSSQCEALRAQNQPTLPSQMALERDINPFLRVRQGQVAQAAQGYDAQVPLDDAVAVLAALRQWKNEFR